MALTNAEMVNRWIAPGVPTMLKLAEELAKRPKSKLAMSTRINDDRVVQAIRRFRDGNDYLDYRMMRLVTYGCCRWIETDQYAIVSDPLAIRRLCSSVASYADNPRALRRLYLGLLKSYFECERHAGWFSAGAQTGTEALRRYLAENKEATCGILPTLQRLEVLRTYPQLLEPDPGRHFARGWLAGQHEEFIWVTEKLEISGASWIASETVKAALTEACHKDDPSFKAYIPAFLSAASDQRFQPIRDDIYEGLLTRYAAMPSPAPHPQLRDALIVAWKNPWMSRNDGAWGRVSEHARNLVAGWLKLELIHQFFEVLSEDGRQDRRRFEFWKSYYEHIDDVYFALGSDAYYSKHPDLAQLRRAAEDRVLELTSAPPRTHAFVMCMGERVVVEFSQNGHAVHTFPKRSLQIGPTTKSINLSSLKIAMGHDRWIHRGDWEDDFHHRLAKKSERPKSALTSSTPPGGRGTASKWATQSTTQHTWLDSRRDSEIFVFARMQNIRLQDRRPLGGNLWLFYLGQERAIIARLEDWGFAFAKGKGWWRNS